MKVTSIVAAALLAAVPIVADQHGHSGGVHSSGEHAAQHYHSGVDGQHAHHNEHSGGHQDQHHAQEHAHMYEREADGEGAAPAEGSSGPPAGSPPPQSHPQHEHQGPGGYSKHGGNHAHHQGKGHPHPAMMYEREAEGEDAAPAQGSSSDASGGPNAGQKAGTPSTPLPPRPKGPKPGPTKGQGAALHKERRPWKQGKQPPRGTAKQMYIRDIVLEARDAVNEARDAYIDTLHDLHRLETRDIMAQAEFEF